MKRHGAVVLLGVLAFWGCKSAPSPKAPKGAVHVVRKGETAYGIAKRYGTTVDTLKELNDLHDPEKIHVGQELVVGAKPVPKNGVSTEPLSLNCDATVHQDGLLLQSTPSSVGFVWPVDGVVISPFGRREGEPHEGIDIAAPLGTPIVASAPGTVVFVGQQDGYGNLVILAHESDRVTVYAHNAKNCVAEGDRVAQGAMVGHVGRSGGAQSPFVHFEVRVGSKTVNPRKLLP